MTTQPEPIIVSSDTVSAYQNAITPIITTHLDSLISSVNIAQANLITEIPNSLSSVPEENKSPVIAVLEGNITGTFDEIRNSIVREFNAAQADLTNLLSSEQGSG